MSDNESQEERRASQRRNNRRCRRRRNIPLPSKLEVTGGHLQSNWKKFRRLWDSYEIVTELKEDQGFRSATFLSCAGSEGLDIFGGLPFDNEEERTKSWHSTAKVWRILHWRKTKQKLLSLMCYETSSCRRVSGKFCLWFEEAHQVLHFWTWKRDFFKTKLYWVWKMRASEQNC